MVLAQSLQNFEHVIFAFTQRGLDVFPRAEGERRVRVVHVGEALHHRPDVTDGVSIAGVYEGMEGGSERPLDQVGKLRAEKVIEGVIPGRKSRRVVLEEGVVVDSLAQNVVNVRRLQVRIYPEIERVEANNPTSLCLCFVAAVPEVLSNFPT